MKVNTLLVVLLVIVLITNVLMIGLYLHEKGILFPAKGDETVVNQSSGNETKLSMVIYKKCNELGGNKCDFDESCTGAWLAAADSFTCCSLECVSRSESTGIVNETFDAKIEEFQLGEII